MRENTELLFPLTYKIEDVSAGVKALQKFCLKLLFFPCDTRTLKGIPSHKWFENDPGCSGMSGWRPVESFC